jgi:hypothetical protein
MTWFIDTTSKRRLPAKFAAGLAVATLLVLGVGVASARADDRDHRGGERHEERGHGGWNGGYYRAPPVVYGGYGGYAPGYYAPPVVYGPGVGIALPGINLNFR